MQFYSRNPCPKHNSRQLRRYNPQFSYNEWQDFRHNPQIPHELETYGPCEKYYSKEKPGWFTKEGKIRPERPDWQGLPASTKHMFEVPDDTNPLGIRVESGLSGRGYSQEIISHLLYVNHPLDENEIQIWANEYQVSEDIIREHLMELHKRVCLLEGHINYYLDLVPPTQRKQLFIPAVLARRYLLPLAYVEDRYEEAEWLDKEAATNFATRLKDMPIEYEDTAPYSALTVVKKLKRKKGESGKKPGSHSEGRHKRNRGRKARRGPR